MKRLRKFNSISAHLITRRMWIVSALAVTLTACGGSTSEERPDAEITMSAWSPTLLQAYSTHVGVGDNGSVYGLSSGNGTGNLTLMRFSVDGKQISFGGQVMQWAAADTSVLSVAEDPVTRAVFVAEGLTAQYGLNVFIGKGGSIKRMDTAGDVIKIFESTTVTPVAIAHHRSGNIYFLDGARLGVYRLSPQGEVNLLAQLSQGLPDVGASLFATRFQIGVSDSEVVYIWTSRTGSADFVRVRGATVENLSSLIPAASILGIGVYRENVYALQRLPVPAGPNGSSVVKQVLRKINSDGSVLTVAGSENGSDQLQFGSPGTIDRSTSWLGLTPDGIVHLRTPERYYSVKLR